GFPYNVAVRTGMMSGVFVIDIDGEIGQATLDRLEAEHGRLPNTLTSTTGKGRHLWFTCTSDIACSTGKIGPGIDVRAGGGYVVVPPSIHPNGTTYRWLNDLPPAAAPNWLIELTRCRPSLPSIEPEGGCAWSFQAQPNSDSRY